MFKVSFLPPHLNLYNLNRPITQYSSAGQRDAIRANADQWQSTHSHNHDNQMSVNKESYHITTKEQRQALVYT